MLTEGPAEEKVQGFFSTVVGKVFLTGKEKKTGGQRETRLSDFLENYGICHFDFG